MRIMFDSINADAVPADARIVAGYVGGRWPDAAALAARFPNALVVTIAVSASERARCLDVENGDATPQQAPGWAQEQRAAGEPWPWVYMNEATWPAVRAAFAAAGVADPLWFVAQYDGDPVLAGDQIAKQYQDVGPYDQSVVADYVPGLDPAPDPAPPIPLEDTMAWLISVSPDPTQPGTSGTTGIFTVDGGVVVHVDGPSYTTALTARLGDPVPVSPAYYQGLLAAAPGSPATAASVVAADVVADIAADLAPKAAS